MSTHPSTDLPLSAQPPNPVCLENRRAATASRLGFHWGAGEARRKEEKQNERQWFLFVKKQSGRKKDYSIICMCVLFYCNQMERVTIVF